MSTALLLYAALKCTWDTAHHSRFKITISVSVTTNDNHEWLIALWLTCTTALVKAQVEGSGGPGTHSARPVVEHFEVQANVFCCRHHGFVPIRVTASRLRR